MTIGKKLTLIGTFLLGLTLILGVSSLMGIKSLVDIAHLLANDSLAGVSACGKVESDLMEMRGDMWRHIASPDANEKASMDREIQRLQQTVMTDLQDVEKSIFAEEEREINRRIKPELEHFQKAWESIALVSQTGTEEEAAKLFVTQGTPAFNAVKVTVRAETEFNRLSGNANTAAATATGSRVTWLTWVMLLVSMLAGSSGLFWIIRSVNSGLKKCATELAEGSQQITSAASQVATSSQTLAQGASEQAASLEETSASTQELTSMTRKNAENSKTAAEVMATVDREVKEGNHTLGLMVVSMQEINASSDKISKIIKVIDEIAFQTNILALNAAVEAARAGEAGMGFAVVADEVRNLAQRSAQAAKDTSALIEESINTSREGSAKLEQVAGVIRAITESSTKVKTLVDEVNIGSQEQARGIDQIAKAVAQMDQVTQGTAASAEESASASEELSAQAQALNQIVGQLGSMVGGSEQTAHTYSSHASSSQQSRPGMGRSLGGLKSAVALPKPKKGSPAPVLAGPTRDRDDFPMDDNFEAM